MPRKSYVRTRNTGLVSNAIINTRFSGLNSLVQTNIYTDGVERRFDGTDNLTGQFFGSASPQAYGSQLATPVIQFLGGPGRNPDTVWETQFVTNAPGGLTALRMRRLLSHSQPSQMAYRLFPGAIWSSQGMYYCRKKIFIPSAFPTSSTGQFMVDEIKVNGGGETEDRLAVILTRENFSGADRWFGKLAATWTDGTSVGTWTGSTPVTPTQQSTFGSSMYNYGAFELSADGLSFNAAGKYVTTEFACRLEDGLNRVAGNGPRGWAWYAWSIGTATAPPSNGSGTTKAYVEARNMSDNFAASAPSGSGIIFPFNLYSTLPIEGMDFYLHSLEVYDYWPSDASSHPSNAV